METLKLKSRPREEHGSAASRRLRRAGELPANLTGLGEAPVTIAIPEHEFERLHEHGVRLVELDLDGTPVEALVREIQYDTFGDRVLHVDFDRIERGHRIEVEVAFEFFGEPAGVEAGGLFVTLMDSVTVECLPSEIPGGIEIDVRALEIGKEIRLRDVTFPEGVTPVDVEPDELIAHVAEPESEPEEEGEELLAEGGGSEPEVIGRKEKQEGEEGED